MADLTYLNENAGESVKMFLARDDKTTFVVMRFARIGEDWEHQDTKDYPLPTPHSARSAMVAYGRDLLANGFARSCAPPRGST